MKLDQEKQQQIFWKKFKNSKLKDVKAKTYPGAQTSRMENFPKIVNGFKSLTIVAKLSTLYAYMDPSLFADPTFTLYEKNMEITPELKGL